MWYHILVFVFLLAILYIFFYIIFTQAIILFYYISLSFALFLCLFWVVKLFDNETTVEVWLIELSTSDVNKKTGLIGIYRVSCTNVRADKSNIGDGKDINW